MRARLLLVLAAALAGAACFQERLDVDVTTRIHPDGTCERRIEYRLRALRHDKNGTARPFPSIPRRTVSGFRSSRPASAGKSVTRSAAISTWWWQRQSCPSPNDVGSDYSRAYSPRVPAASNTISYGCENSEDEGEVCEYAELFFDPASPPAVVRSVIRWMLSHDDDFAKGMIRALGPGAPKSQGPEEGLSRALRATPRRRAPTGSRAGSSSALGSESSSRRSDG